jgi:3'(2'), 5'-bisphosphate nucleotidase
MKFENELEKVKPLVLQAGEAILKMYATGVSFREKENGEGPVTEADLAANAILLEGLHSAFPQDWVCSEETPDHPDRLKAKRVWCVDPLDGTYDFLNHTGEFAVQVGLIENGIAVLGFVYLPASEKLFYGGPGIGTFLEDKAQRRSVKPRKSKNLEEMILTTSRFHRNSRSKRLTQFLNPKNEILHGSIGGKVALILDQRADFFVVLGSNIKEWDLCAPEAILQGAGGILTDADCRPLVYNKPLLNSGQRAIVASGGSVHEILCAKVREFLA